MSHFYRLIILAAVLTLAPCALQSADNDCGCSEMRVALKSNLLHDALLTPDFGIEVRLPGRFSVGVEGIMAWWSNDRRHHCWHIYGGWAEVRYWFAEKPLARAMTGHHVGVYGSVHSFDFEFGEGHGWQTPGVMWGVGVSYGYSWRLNDRLNLDLGARVGYAEGEMMKYDVQCGMHVCSGREMRRYFGLTDFCVTLVWFPGKNTKNNPNLIVY